MGLTASQKKAELLFPSFFVYTIPTMTCSKKFE